MPQIIYDDQYYYKLVTNAKTQETTTIRISICPHSGSSSGRCGNRYDLLHAANQLSWSFYC